MSHRRSGTLLLASVIVFSLAPIRAALAVPNGTVAVTMSPTTHTNAGTARKAITLTATLPAMFGGFQNTQRAVLWIDKAFQAGTTLPVADADGDGTTDCLQDPPVEGDRCRVDKNIVPLDDYSSDGGTLEVQFIVDRVAPTTAWNLTTFDDDGASWTCPARQNGVGCFTVTGGDVGVTTVTLDNGGPLDRPQGSGSVGVTVKGFNFYPGATIRETEPLDGVEVRNVERVNSTTMTAMIEIGDSAPVTSDAFQVANTDGKSKGLGIQIVSGPRITRFSPSEIVRGSSGVAVQVDGESFVTGTSPTTFTASPAASLVIKSPTVTSETSATFTVDVPANATPGPVTITAENPNRGGKGTAVLTIIPEPPLVTTLTPSALGQGAVDAPLVMAGQHLDPAATYAFSGTGITVGPCAGTASSITCDTDIEQETATGERTLTVTPSGGTARTMDPKLTVNAAPTVTDLTPDKIGAGAVGRRVTAVGSGLTTGARMEFSASLTTSACAIIATGLECTVDVDAAATVGPYTPAIINADHGRAPCGGTTCDIEVTAAPSVTEVAPNRLAKGATATLTVTGSGFRPDVTVNFGDGVTLGQPTVSQDGTRITVSATIDQGAAIGARPATVENGDGGRGTLNGALQVIGPVALTSVEPDHIGRGAQSGIITLIGSSLNEDTTVDLGPGITVVSRELDGDTLERLKVTVDVTTDASTAPRAVKVTNEDGSSATLPAGLHVDPIPALTAGDPATVGQGAIGRAMRFVGTGLLDGATVTADDLAFETVEVDPDGRWIDVLVDAEPEAELGSRELTVHNDNFGAPGTCPSACASLTAKPRLSSVSPSSRGAGATSSLVSANGSGILPGALLELGEGVTVVPEGDATDTRLQVRVTVAPEAAPGPRPAVIVNGDGGRSTPLSNGFRVGAPPAIESVTPSELPEGPGSFLISGTGFVHPLQVHIGHGVSTESVDVAQDGTSAIVHVDVAAGSREGSRDIRVTNPDDGTSLCRECVGVGDSAVPVGVSTPGVTGNRVTFSFYDSVRGVTADNVQLSERDSAAIIESRRTCFDLQDAEQDCATSTAIRRVDLVPAATLVPGEYYAARVNPPGVPPLVRSSDDGEVPSSATTFRSSRFLQEDAPAVTHTWQLVRDGNALGGRFVRESRGGASATVGFTGDSATWIAPMGPEFGTARVLVDGDVVAADVDTSRAREGRRRTTFTGFGPGAHVMQIVVKGKLGANGDGTFVGLDAIEDADGVRANPTYAGRWASRSESRVPSGTVAIAGLAGEAAELVFRGTAITVGLVGGSGGGTANVLVDGKVRARVDLSSGGSREVTIDRLLDRRHEINVVVSPASPGLVRLDRFRIG